MGDGLMKSQGDPISAEDWNRLARLASREVRGANVISDENGWMIADLPSRADFARWVRVKKTGGDWGDAEERCSWIYDLYGTNGDLTPDNLIVAGVSNVFGRAPAGRYHPAEDGTLALARYDPEGDPTDPDDWLLLAVIDEVPDIAVCNSAPVGG